VIRNAQKNRARVRERFNFDGLKRIKARIVEQNFGKSQPHQTSVPVKLPIFKFAE
jgi:hypothetical protein